MNVAGRRLSESRVRENLMHGLRWQAMETETTAPSLDPTLIRCGSEKNTAPDQWHYNQLYFESGIFPVLGKYFPYNTAYKSNSA